MEKYLAFIPVRGGSKSIPLKNIKLFCGKPLIAWTAMAASQCLYIDRIYVATDSEDIKAVVEGLDLPKVQVIGRGADTATDEATTESAMLEFALNYEAENIVLIQATSPLLTASDLMGGLNMYESGQYNSLLSVVPQRRFIWQESMGDGYPMNYDPARRPRRQIMQDYYVENGAFYITSRERLLRTGSRISGRVGLYKMSEASYFEIDEPDDWEIMEKLKEQQMKSF